MASLCQGPLTHETLQIRTILDVNPFDLKAQEAK